MARRRKWHRCSSGFKYDMNGNGVSPFFIGAAAAEFLPADPQVWFDAASATGMTATFDLAKVVDKDAESFLQGCTDDIEPIVRNRIGREMISTVKNP